MPLPKPKPNEKQSDFISRCIRFVKHENPDTPNEQAAAMCYTQWRNRNKEKEEGGEMKVLKHFNAEWITTEHGNIKNMKATKQGNYPAVAVVGDRFMNKEFMFATELKKAYKSMDGKYHNLDHGRKHDGQISIADIIGFHTNTEFDDDSKRMIIHIQPEEEMPAYQTWKAFLLLNSKAERHPHVSVECFVKEKMIKADELKDLIILEDHNLKPDDDVVALYDYDFVGAATVKEGAGGDECSIGMTANTSDYAQTMTTTEYGYEYQQPDGTVITVRYNDDNPPVDPNIKKPKKEQELELLKQQNLLLKQMIKEVKNGRRPKY